MIWVGTCGFGRRRMDAFRDLDAVEVQETFYRPVPPERAARWGEGAPERFSFAVKASQFITHEASSRRTGGRAGRRMQEPVHGRRGMERRRREFLVAMTVVAVVLVATGLLRLPFYQNAVTAGLWGLFLSLLVAAGFWIWRRVSASRVGNRT